MIDDAAIKLRYAALDPVLDERGRRRFAAAEALAAGRGGVTAVARITGIARSTIDRGLAELRGDAPPEAAADRVRRMGGGRRALVVTDPTLLTDLKDLVEPTTRGDPTTPLLWTAKSLRNLAAGLRELGHRIGHNVVADLLRVKVASPEGWVAATQPTACGLRPRAGTVGGLHLRAADAPPRWPGRAHRDRKRASRPEQR